MEGLGVLLFIVFAVLAALSNARKTGRGTGVPRPGTRWPPRDAPPFPGRAPLPRVPGWPGAERPPAQGRPPAADTGEESAADLVPDDLWAILTGERRPAAPTRHPAPPQASPPAPLPEAEEPEWTEDSSLEREQAEAAWPAPRRAKPPREAAPVEAPSAPPAASPPGPVLSMARESTVAVTSSPTVPDDEAAAPFGASAAPRPLKARALLATPGDLRRAFMLREVLGPPKSLE